MAKIGIVMGLIVLTAVQAPSYGFAQETGESSIDPVQGVTITVAAGVAAGANSYYYRRQIQASNLRNTRENPFLVGTGSDLLSRKGEDAAKLAELALEGTRRGDILTIDYTPGTVSELRNAVSDLESGTVLWEKRIGELSKELSKLHRQIQVEKNTLASLPLSPEAQESRGRSQTRLDKLEREFRYVNGAELDAQQRLHHVRSLFEAEKKNLAIAEKTGRTLRTHVRMEFPVDEKTRSYLQGYVVRIATTDGKNSSRDALRRAPSLRISRVHLPNIERSVQLLKEARRGAWIAGIGAVVALEEIAVGRLSEDLRNGLEAVDVIAPRNEAPKNDTPKNDTVR